MGRTLNTRSTCKAIGNTTVCFYTDFGLREAATECVIDEFERAKRMMQDANEKNRKRLAQHWKDEAFRLKDELRRRLKELERANELMKMIKRAI
jgi:flagellar motility protein MotE (MotC chaperone)